MRPQRLPAGSLLTKDARPVADTRPFCGRMVPVRAVPSPAVRLRQAVDHARTVLDESADTRRAQLLAQLDDYVLPRLEHLDAPLLAVVGGPTGAGKSTLVNALVGEVVTRSGVIRPTTRQPMILCNPADEAWFESTSVLPSLARVRGDGDLSSTASVRLRTTEALPAGLALLDAPDFDSVDDGNRALAAQLLAAADLWLFVTTPARYADALPWGFLRDASARDIEVAMVLNRVEDDALAAVAEDLRGMLAEAGLADAPLFTVDAVPGLAGPLPPEHVAPLREHLARLAHDAASRRAIAARTVAGAIRGAAERAMEIAAALEAQEAQADQLEAAIAARYEAAAEQVTEATSDGRLLRDEVLGRWQDFVGTSDVFRRLEHWFSRAVDRAAGFFKGRPSQLREVEVEIEHGLHAVVVDAAESAAAQSWSAVGAAHPQLRAQAGADLGRASGDIGDRSAEQIRAWQASLVETIQQQAGGKRIRARVMSLGLNVITVALMIVVFASTGGLTGGELAIAGGSAVIGQKLLETIFGEDAVRRLAAWARQELDERVRVLMEAEAARYDQIIAPLRAGTPAAQLRQRAAEAAASAAELRR